MQTEFFMRALDQHQRRNSIEACVARSLADLRKGERQIALSQPEA